MQKKALHFVIKKRRFIWTQVYLSPPSGCIDDGVGGGSPCRPSSLAIDDHCGTVVVSVLVVDHLRHAGSFQLRLKRNKSKE